MPENEIEAFIEKEASSGILEGSSAIIRVLWRHNGTTPATHVDGDGDGHGDGDGSPNNEDSDDDGDGSRTTSPNNEDSDTASTTAIGDTG